MAPFDQGGEQLHLRNVEERQTLDFGLIEDPRKPLADLVKRRG